MVENNLYTLEIDDNLDGKFREMQKRFKEGEKIVSTNIDGKKMFVTTEVPERDGKNLLLDALRAGKMPGFGHKVNDQKKI